MSDSPIPKHSPIVTSMQLSTAILKACGISSSNVVRVAVDLTGPTALLHVTTTVPAFVNGLITEEMESFELVRRPQEARSKREALDFGAPTNVQPEPS